MTAEEAIAILDPETRRKTLREIPVMDRIEADQEACRIAVAALRNLLQTSEPLTLEELREMDGEPVWVAPVSDGGAVHERWMLVAGFWVEKGIYLFMPSSGMTQGYKARSYGKTWLAYRRKPEEGAT